MSDIIEVWYAASGNTRAKSGYIPISLANMGNNGTIPSNNRSLLLYGTYKPSAATTGTIDGSTLIDYGNTAVDTVVIRSETNLVSRKIWGDVIIDTNAPVTFTNCLFVGGSHKPDTKSALLSCLTDRPGINKVIVNDCSFIPRVPAINRDGIRGHNFAIYRSEIANVTDGIECFKFLSQGTIADIIVMGNWIHDLTYWYPAYDNGVSGAVSYTDGTRNNCVQIFGGSDIRIRGNFLQGTSVLGSGSSVNPEKPWLLSGAYKYANGACVLMEKLTATAPFENVVIDENYFEGGLYHFYMKPGSYTFQNNKHSRNVAVGSGHRGYWVRGENKATTIVTGLTTSNRWEDNNAILAEPRISGIYWNA